MVELRSLTVYLPILTMIDERKLLEKKVTWCVKCIPVRVNSFRPYTLSIFLHSFLRRKQEFFDDLLRQVHLVLMHPFFL